MARPSGFGYIENNLPCVNRLLQPARCRCTVVAAGSDELESRPSFATAFLLRHQSVRYHWEPVYRDLEGVRHSLETVRFWNRCEGPEILMGPVGVATALSHQAFF